MTYLKRTRDQHFQDSGPKRILALDGGGTRGIVTLSYLARIEALLRARHGDDPAFRLCDYFDLIAGTSTGAIIAAGLARGMSVAEITQIYNDLAEDVFRRRWYKRGVFRALFSHRPLERLLQQTLGAETTMGDPSLRTGLLIVSKRMDTGSPWPIGNNPRGKYYDQRPGATDVPNKDYRLSQVVRASTAAPYYFAEEEILIRARDDGTRETGRFVDGGVTPFNNPALQAFLYATLEGYNVNWDTGAGGLLIVSVGTGRDTVETLPGFGAAHNAIKSLFSLMDDTGSLTETLMQWMGVGHTHRKIDSEIGTLLRERTGSAQFTYARYDLRLDWQRINSEMPHLTRAQKDGLTGLDRPDVMPILAHFAEGDAKVAVDGAHFPPEFDLPWLVARDGLRPYRRRAGTPVTAVQIALETQGLEYKKWGGTQTAKPGDWLVNNGGDVHTVDRESFEATYRAVGLGTYVKDGAVWAEQANTAGTVDTKEGATAYAAGDWIVYNEPERQDGYAMKPETFARLYRPA